MSPPQGERKRAKKPKTRTGCITCKSRRVKCDEAKPNCARCIRFGIECEGYLDPYPVVELLKEQGKGRHQFKLIPRADHSQALNDPLIGVFAFSSPFHNQKQNQYFLFFQEQTVSELSGPFDEGLFSKIALQACYNEPTLMRLIAAIGALDKSSRQSSRGAGGSEAILHKEQALLNYGLALKGIQEIINTPNTHSSRIVLIAALLIYCFENLHGDIVSARKHMESALHLMHKQLSQKTYIYRHTERKSPTADLEDSIIAAFVRLDNGLYSRPDIILEGSEDISPGPIHGILEVNYHQDVDTFPSEFESLHEARNYLETLQYHSLPLLTREFHARIKHSSRVPDLETTRAYEEATRDFHLWNKAFTPLYIKANLPSSPGTAKLDFMGTGILRARGMTTVLAIQSLFPVLCSPTGCDAPSELTYNCLEVLDLAQKISAEPKFRRNFVFDCGVVPGVFMAMVAPVDIEITKEALRIMKSLVPRREGAWDSAALVKVGEAYLENLLASKARDKVAAEATRARAMTSVLQSCVEIQQPH